MGDHAGRCPMTRKRTPFASVQRRVEERWPGHRYYVWTTTTGTRRISVQFGAMWIEAAGVTWDDAFDSIDSQHAARGAR